MAITVQNLERKRGDTRIIVFIITDADDNLVDISSWSTFLLTVHTIKKPVDNTTREFQISGVFVTDGTDSKIGFEPSGTTNIGTYYYDAQGLDSLGNICTFVEGKYKLTQDKTKE